MELTEQCSIAKCVNLDRVEVECPSCNLKFCMKYVAGVGRCVRRRGMTHAIMCCVLWAGIATP